MSSGVELAGSGRVSPSALERRGSGEGADLGLPPEELAAAEAAAAVASETLEGGEEKKSENFLACVIEPASKFYAETVKPALLAAINWIRDTIFWWICPATVGPRTKDVKLGDEDLTEEQLAQLEQNRFARNEQTRFEYRAVVGGAQFKFVGSGTVSRTAAQAFRGVVAWDKKWVGGESAAPTAAAVEERLAGLDAKKAFREFRALDTNARADILHYAALAANIEESEEGTWTDGVMANKEGLAGAFIPLRLGIGEYFRVEAEKIEGTRRERLAAAAAEKA